jgi:hypothetical protein
MYFSNLSKGTSQMWTPEPFFVSISALVVRLEKEEYGNTDDRSVKWNTQVRIPVKK